MPRANRYYIPGYVWHITHRCHKKEFLYLATRNQTRDSKWTESIAVGNESYIEATKQRLGIKAKGRKIIGGNKSYELRELAVPYGGNFTPENGSLGLRTFIIGMILYKYQ